MSHSNTYSSELDRPSLASVAGNDRGLLYVEVDLGDTHEVLEP